jgi:hypothetical protein
MRDAPAPDHQIGGLARHGRADAVIAAIAGGQHGVVSRAQLLAAGVSRRQIERRIEAKRLHVVHRAVYAAGHAALSQEGRWMAAVLAAGSGAALSHWSAAALLRLRGGGRGPRSHVTSPRNRRGTRALAFHHAHLRDDERTVEDGIPVTTPARTLVDLAPALPAASLARMLDAAEQRGAPLAALIARYPRRAGAAKLRAAAGQPVAWTRSDLEGWFLEELDRAGLPRPQVNALVGGYEVDFVWREYGVVAELDTYMTHGSRLAFERDRERDRRLTAAGWRVVRVTERQRAEAVADLRRLLAATAAPDAKKKAGRADRDREERDLDRAAGTGQIKPEAGGLPASIVGDPGGDL